MEDNRHSHKGVFLNDINYTDISHITDWGNFNIHKHGKAEIGDMILLEKLQENGSP